LGLSNGSGSYDLDRQATGLELIVQGIEHL